MKSTRSAEDDLHCTELVKNNAHDFYLANLLLPDTIRHAIIALHAFHVEITNITLGRGEPMMRQMKLQWWRDVLSDERRDEAQGNPVSRALLCSLTEHNLPAAPLCAKIEAHVFDLYNDPMGDRSMLEGYCGETRSILFQYASLIAGLKATQTLSDASGHSGVAAGIVSILQNLQFTRQRQQVYVPSDLLNAVGLSQSEFHDKPHPNHGQAVEGLIDLAFEHNEKANTALSNLPKPARLVFKPLALVSSYLNAAQKNPMLLYDGSVTLSQLRKQWILWRF